MNFLREFIKAWAGRGEIYEISRDLPENHTPEDIERAIALLFDPKNRWLVEPWLYRRLADARPFLEQAYLDGNLPAQLISNDIREAGIRQRIIALLASAGSPVIEAELLRLWTKTGNEKLVAQWASELGTTAVLPVIATALSSEDHGIVDPAIRGLNYAYRRSNVGAAVTRAILPCVESLLAKSTGIAVGYVASLLLKLDHGRAISKLTAASTFNARNHDIGRLLRVLRAYAVPLPNDQLTTIFEEVSRRPSDRRESRNLGELLCTMATQRHPETLVYAEKYRSGYLGRTALEIWHGIDPYSALREQRQHCAWEMLAEPLRVYGSISGLVGEVGNGGITQYFANSSGDHARDALAGLSMLGLNAAATALRQEMARFGPSGPNPDRGERNRQLDSMLPENDSGGGMQHINDTSKVIIDSSEAISEALLSYALAHREHFISSKPRQEFGVL